MRSMYLKQTAKNRKENEMKDVTKMSEKEKDEVVVKSLTKLLEVVNQQCELYKKLETLSEEEQDAALEELDRKFNDLDRYEELANRVWEANEESA